MLIVATFSVVVARAVERSSLGYGFTAIRDDEIAAEATGVPTLRLKLVATGLSGASWEWPAPRFLIMSASSSRHLTFNLSYAVNTIAMAMIGGTKTWLGPLIGALLSATVQQVATVTISSEINLMVVGVIVSRLRHARAQRHCRSAAPPLIGHIESIDAAPLGRAMPIRLFDYLFFMTKAGNQHRIHMR